ncbi:MAG: hypothetical protein OEZ23_06655 [Gammaproteobacteria bacterium]|nr:hypothetical protein [Gammaproteobacteria bacterium]
MADAYSIAQKYLEAAISEANENNVTGNALGQALIWKVLEMYKKDGRSTGDIVEEVQYSLDNLDDDNTFHVSRN